MQERLPQEYEKCMSGINRVLQLTWEIAEIPTEDKTRLQALLNLTKVTSSRYLTTNGVVITDAIKFVQTNKEKLLCLLRKDNNGKESKESDYDDEDKDQLEEETGKIKQETTNQVF